MPFQRYTSNRLFLVLNTNWRARWIIPKTEASVSLARLMSYPSKLKFGSLMSRTATLRTSFAPCPRCRTQASTPRTLTPTRRIIAMTVYDIYLPSVNSTSEGCGCVGFENDRPLILNALQKSYGEITGTEILVFRCSKPALRCRVSAPLRRDRRRAARPLQPTLRDISPACRI